MSDMPAPAQQPAAIAEGFADAGLREALASPDWAVRQRAQEAWSEKFRGVYGDVTPETPHPSEAAGLLSTSILPSALASSFYAEEPGDLPPDASCYPVHPAFDEIPELAGALRAWAHEAQLTIPEFTEVVAVLGRIEAEREDVAAWPAHIREARDRALQETFLAMPEGQQTLTRARAVWGEVQRSHPWLAGVLDQAGVTGNHDFVQALAKLWRGG